MGEENRKHPYADDVKMNLGNVSQISAFLLAIQRYLDENRVPKHCL